MSVESALYEHLKARAGVTALVGTGSSARIYPDKAPIGAAFPYIVFKKVVQTHEHHFGTSAAAGVAGIAKATIQIDCWDDDRLGALALAEAVRDGIDGLTQSTLGANGQTVRVQYVHLDDDKADLVAPLDASDVGTYRVIMDFSICYVESVPSLA